MEALYLTSHSNCSHTFYNKSEEQNESFISLCPASYPPPVSAWSLLPKLELFQDVTAALRPLVDMIRITRCTLIWGVVLGDGAPAWSAVDALKSFLGWKRSKRRISRPNVECFSRLGLGIRVRGATGRVGDSHVA